MNILVVASNKEFKALGKRFFSYFKENSVRHIDKISLWGKRELIAFSPDIILSEIEMPDFEPTKLKDLFIPMMPRMLNIK